MRERMRRCGVVGGAVLLVMLALAGCSKEREAVPARKTFGQQELLIGLIPEQNIFRQRERYLVLRKYLSERLGMTVNFTSLSRYGNIVERFSAERMDGAFFGSFTYGLARQQLGVEPLVRPLNLDGTSTYHGYIFARKDSGIRKAADMRGKRFAFVEHATTAGLPVSRWHISRQAASRMPSSSSARASSPGAHDAAILAVLNREADVGAAKNTIYDQLAGENRRIEQELVILAASGVRSPELSGRAQGPRPGTEERAEAGTARDGSATPKGRPSCGGSAHGASSRPATRTTATCTTLASPGRHRTCAPTGTRTSETPTGMKKRILIGFTLLLPSSSPGAWSPGCTSARPRKPDGRLILLHQNRDPARGAHHPHPARSSPRSSGAGVRTGSEVDVLIAHVQEMDKVMEFLSGLPSRARADAGGSCRCATCG